LARPRSYHKITRFHTYTSSQLFSKRMELPNTSLRLIYRSNQENDCKKRKTKIVPKKNSLWWVNRTYKDLYIFAQKLIAKFVYIFAQISQPRWPIHLCTFFFNDIYPCKNLNCKHPICKSRVAIIVAIHNLAFWFRRFKRIDLGRIGWTQVF